MDIEFGNLRRQSRHESYVLQREASAGVLQPSVYVPGRLEAGLVREWVKVGNGGLEALRVLHQQQRHQLVALKPAMHMSDVACYMSST